MGRGVATGVSPPPGGRPRLAVAHSGSSAPQLGVACLEALHGLGSIETHLVISEGDQLGIEHELSRRRA